MGRAIMYMGRSCFEMKLVNNIEFIKFFCLNMYSRPSVAQKLMAGLPRLFSTCS